MWCPGESLKCWKLLIGCVYVCVCVWKRERDRERKRKREIETKRASEEMGETERERETKRYRKREREERQKDTKRGREKERDRQTDRDREIRVIHCPMNESSPIQSLEHGEWDGRIEASVCYIVRRTQVHWNIDAISQSSISHSDKHPATLFAQYSCTCSVAHSWTCTSSCKLKGTNWIMNSKGWKALPPQGTYTAHAAFYWVQCSHEPKHRPFWSKCAEFVRGGPDKWAELSKGRSSNELVDVLLAEISGLDISEIATGDLFQAQVWSPSHYHELLSSYKVTNSANHDRRFVKIHYPS